MSAQKQKGFTLVELLVVILIIAILATIGLVIYGSAQKSARISKRIQDLKAIQTALELYYSAKGAYPISTSWSSCNAIPSGLVPKYMPAYPTDPHTTGCYYYISSSTGSDYKLRDRCASDTPCDMSSTDYASQLNLIDPARDNGWESGGDCSKVDSTSYKAWALFSSNTGVNDGEAAKTGGDGYNPACW